MSITVAMPTRGRHELVAIVAQRMAQNATLADTRIVVGIDDDDVPPRWDQMDDHLIVSCGSREDSLGAKYNRCAAAAPADIYVMATDDCTIETPGWDAMLTKAFAQTFPDDIGAVYFGSMAGAGFESGLPAMQAVTRGLVDRMGFFACPYFPFWWHDTWLDEIARMIDRVVGISNIEVSYPDKSEARRTRGARDILFWARFFDEMRGLRCELARDIIISPGFSNADQQTALLLRMEKLSLALAGRNSCLRDPAHVARLERSVAFDAPEDARYQRIKQAASAILDDACRSSAAEAAFA